MLKPRKRITRRKLKEDKFVTFTFKAQSFIEQHKNKFLFSGISLCAIILITYFYVSSGKEKARDAEAELGKAELYYASGGYETAIGQLQKIVDEYGGTSGAGRAAFYLANSHFMTGNYPEARKYYQIYVDDYHSDDILTSSSYSGIGQCFEAEENYQEAVYYYEQAVEKFSKVFLAPQFLLNLGRCYELTGSNVKARESYSRILEQYPESLYTQNAERFLSKL